MITLSDRTLTANITRAARAASADDWATGLGWYDEAQRVAGVIATEHGITADRAAGIIAALSPRCQWSTNVVFAERVAAAAARGGSCPDVSTTANRGTAWLIATGTEPLDALGTVHPRTGRVISGHKVRSFWANITGDHDAVTVDMWAYAVACNAWQAHPTTGARIPTDADMTAADYARIAAAYRRAARILSRERGVTVSPRDLQAAVWVAARGHKPADVAFHAAAARRAA